MGWLEYNGGGTTLVLVGGMTTVGCATVATYPELGVIPLIDDVTRIRGFPPTLERAYIT